MDTLTVLLFDANPIFLQQVTRFLVEHAPGQLIVSGAASDASEALALAKRLSPDVVLVGLASSAQPGLELLPQLRARLSRSGIIVLGIVDVNGYRRAVRAAGADAFVLKDDVPTTLVPAIMDVMRGRRAD
jgi:two-component system, NarL family, nitrate/nitrite response regulator NarP